jgi:hypothetical protein
MFESINTHSKLTTLKKHPHQVGFGDFFPTTTFSRAFLVFATFGGVIFFSYMTVHVFHIFEVESSGRGKFVPIARDSGAGRGHILIMGGGITCGSVTILETFLRALCRSDSQTDTPEIVLLGQTKCSEKVSVPFLFIIYFL